MTLDKGFKFHLLLLREGTEFDADPSHFPEDWCGLIMDYAIRDGPARNLADMKAVAADDVELKRPVMPNLFAPGDKSQPAGADIHDLTQMMFIKDQCTLAHPKAHSPTSFPNLAVFVHSHHPIP